MTRSRGGWDVENRQVGEEQKAAEESALKIGQAIAWNKTKLASFWGFIQWMCINSVGDFRWFFYYIIINSSISNTLTVMMPNHSMMHFRFHFYRYYIQFSFIVIYHQDQVWIICACTKYCILHRWLICIKNRQSNVISSSRWFADSTISRWSNIP